MLWTANPKAKRKAQGMYREDEVNGSAEMVARVAGIMRVYFTMLVIDHPKPMAKVYQTGRLWAWLARLMGSPGLLTHPLAAELIYGSSSSYTLSASALDIDRFSFISRFCV